MEEKTDGNASEGSCRSAEVQASLCRSRMFWLGISAFSFVLVCFWFVVDLSKVMEPGPAGFVTWLFLFFEAFLAPFVAFAIWASLKLTRMRCPECPNRDGCRLLIRKTH